MEHWEVAIIGGGIAGLSVGKFLAEKGIPFVLLEEHDKFFQKACGEGFIKNIATHEFYDLYGSKKGLYNEIWETVIHTKYGPVIVEMPIIMTNKNIVEKELARQAQLQGTIRMGEKVDKIVDGVLIPQQIKPKIIVGADGCFSLVRDYIGVHPPKLGMAAEGICSETALDPTQCHVIMKKELVKDGYAWYFPKDGLWNIGIGCQEREHFRDAFSKFKQQHVVKKWRGSPLPINRPLKSYGKNAIIIGDAAAHVVALLGEGNMHSMVAAQIAADVIEKQLSHTFNSIDFREYHHRCMHTFGTYLRHLYYISQIFHKAIPSEYIRYKLLKHMCNATSRYYRNLYDKR